jgi:hypothetical protein
MTQYCFNSRNEKGCYHVVAGVGTLCKMQNDKAHDFLTYQDRLSEMPPDGRRLCPICDEIAKRKGATA